VLLDVEVGFVVEDGIEDEGGFPHRGGDDLGAVLGVLVGGPSRAGKPQRPRKKELRRRLIATVTPPTREALDERARATQVSFADILIEAWLHHGEALADEYKPDPLLAKREKVGVRKPR
jgi:phenylpyruvate tautomerase PptA (4-oxalocrotonate tautomerase family)